MSELERYKETIKNSNMTKDEMTEWVHQKWMEYDMTDETETELYDFIENELNL